MIYPNQSRFNSHLPWVMFTSALFLACFILSVIIPPIQSPDEGHHLERIYLLGKGQLVLEAPEGNSSGGMIDSGLLAYLKIYNDFSKPDNKMSQEVADEANTIPWTGKREFDAPSGTGYYFPVIYLPQAVGLAVGEALGLTIDTSYRMARFLVLLSTAIILTWAFLIHRPPLIAAALLMLPMSLFQFSSASLDGMSTAIFVLAISCFSKIAIQKYLSPQYISYLLIACVLLVTSSRAHAITLFALVFASYFYTKNKKALVVGLASFVFVIAWLAISIKMTKNLTFQHAPSASTIALYYLKDPLSLARVLYATLSDSTMLNFYTQSFVGILGKLDTRFSALIYSSLYLGITSILVLSLYIDRIKGMVTYRSLLILCSLSSILLTFIALLIQWNSLQHPASLIQGVQGRYFLIPALLLAYAVGSGETLQKGSVRWIGFLSVLGFSLFSMYSTSSLLISRYYLVDTQPTPVAIKTIPSIPLSTSQQINLNLDNYSANKPLQSISILFATYQRINQGDVGLSMTTKDGKVSHFKLDMTAIKDNQYSSIPLDGQIYSSAEVTADTGGGVSVWLAEDEHGKTAACVIYEYSNGATRYTKGCPR